MLKFESYDESIRWSPEEKNTSCREIAEKFKIGKTPASNAVANEVRLRAEYENF